MAVFRNAAAFGAGAVLLSPTCCDPLYRKAIRTSMAHVLRVPFARVEPWPDAVADLRTAGFTIAALSPRGSAIALDAFVAASSREAVALLVGYRGSGSDRELAAGRGADPMAGRSLNLAVAPGIDSR